MAILLVDDNGLPIPQLFNPATGSFEKLQGTSLGGMAISITNFEDIGNVKSALVDKDGNAVNVLNGAIQTTLSDNKIVPLIKNGDTLDTMTLSTSEVALNVTDVSSLAVSDVIWNNLGRNMLLAFKITGTGTIASIALSINVADTFIPYKTFNVNLAAGNHVVEIGCDAEVNKCIIPSEFRIEVTHSSGARLTYVMVAQIA